MMRLSYQNGSLLIAALQPRFTILHNLSTSRAPSPIVTLAWHASSSRQKSDMLATQTHDGDLRVWSIAKSSNSNDPAKVVRVLKRNDNFQPSANWLGWSKNGRIIQYSEGYVLASRILGRARLTEHYANITAPTAKRHLGTFELRMSPMRTSLPLNMLGVSPFMAPALPYSR